MNKIYDFCWIFLVFCFILFCCNCVLVWQLTFHLILILISFYFIQWTTKIQNYKHQSWILSRFVCLFVCFSILFHLFCINSTVENKIKHLDFKRSEIKVLLDAKDDCFFLLLSVRVYVWVAESIKKVCAVAKKKHGSLSWYFMPECLERLLLFFRSPKLLGSIATLRTVQF